MKHYKITDDYSGFVNNLLALFALPYLLMLMLAGMYSDTYYVKYRGWKTLFFWKTIKTLNNKEDAERFIVEHKYNIIIPKELKTRRNIYKLIVSENKITNNITEYTMSYRMNIGYNKTLPYNGWDNGIVKSRLSKEDCYLKLYNEIINKS